jgi:hypothetical protein
MSRHPTRETQVTHYPAIGTVSSGTLLTSDLLEAFSWELDQLVQRNMSAISSEDRSRYMALVAEAAAASDRDDVDDDDDAAELINDLQDALQEFAPDYVYFGAHPGDGADFGFWVIDDLVQQARDDGTLVVDDTSQIPDDYRGLALHVNDHGNCTLYAIDLAGSHELWSCV